MNGSKEAQKQKAKATGWPKPETKRMGSQQEGWYPQSIRELQRCEDHSLHRTSGGLWELKSEADGTCHVLDGTAFVKAGEGVG